MTNDECQKYKQVKSIRLQVDAEEARILLRQVEHKTFEDALEKHWQLDRDGNVTPESICWLFCWANNGMGKDGNPTQESCRARFNRIFDRKYKWFDYNIGYEFARKFRYRKLRNLQL